MCLKGSKTDIFLILMKTKYEGCCSLTKQIEITLDLLTNGFKSSNSILQLCGNFKISMMIALYVRWSTITILRNAKIFFFDALIFSTFKFSDRNTVTAKQTCQNSYYGCCPDGVTFARGSNYEGCTQSEDRPGIP